MKSAMLIILLLIHSNSIFSETIIIEQKNKQFSKSILNAKVGDTIEFLNSDPFFHNVFLSLIHI